MRTGIVTISVAAALVAAVAGCKGKRESISDSDYLLDLQHRAWENTRESLQSDQPRLGELRTIHRLLSQRTPRRVKMDYKGSNKQEVLDKLKSLSDAFEAGVVPKLDMSAPVVRLKPGVKIEQVREAFMKLDGEYRELEEMTRG